MEIALDKDSEVSKIDGMYYIKIQQLDTNIPASAVVLATGIKFFVVVECSTCASRFLVLDAALASLSSPSPYTYAVALRRQVEERAAVSRCVVKGDPLLNRLELAPAKRDAHLGVDSSYRVVADTGRRNGETVARLSDESAVRQLS